MRKQPPARRRSTTRPRFLSAVIVAATWLGGTDAEACLKTGFKEVMASQTVAVGALFSGGLAWTSETPSINVAGANNPNIEWGDGTESPALLKDRPFVECFDCWLYGSHVYKKAGSYKVRVTYDTGALFCYETEVSITAVMPEYTIVALGDSVASGEGTPDLRATETQGAEWFGTPEACHRSQNAFPTLVGEMLKEANVEFEEHCYPFVGCTQTPVKTIPPPLVISEACSGAKLAEIGRSGDPDEQVEKARKRLTDLPGAGFSVDAVLLSAGANNVGGGFGSVVKACLDEGGRCGQAPSLSDQKLDQSFDAMPGAYEALAERISTRLDPKSVFIAEYFDPTRHSDGSFGPGGSRCLFDALDEDNEVYRLVSLAFDLNMLNPWDWDNSTWEWLYDKVLKPLNQRAASAATANGWNYVGGIASAFRKHGICSYVDPNGSPWVVGVHNDGDSHARFPYLESVVVQKDVDGTSHPNEKGHREIAERVVDAINRHASPTTIAMLRVTGGDAVVGSRISIFKRVTLEFGAATYLFASSGVGKTFYTVYDEAAGPGPSRCSPTNQDACQEYDDGFSVSPTGRTQVVEYFTCNKFNDADGVGCEAPRKLRVDTIEGTDLVLTTQDGDYYVPGTWTNQPVTVELVPPSAPLSSSTFYVLDYSAGDAPCTLSNQRGCSIYDGPFSVVYDRSHVLNYFSRSSLDDCAAVKALYGTVAWGYCQTFGTSLLPGYFPSLDSQVRSAAFNIDRTPPVMTLQERSPAPNSFGWNRSNVTVSWECDDVTSGPVSSKVSGVVTGNGANQSLTRSCKDVAGNVTTKSKGGISIDKVAPSVSIAASRAANAHGWYNAPVTFSWEETDGTADGLSGLAGCSPARSYSGPEVRGASISGSCVDKADNSATASAVVNYDTTPPVVEVRLDRGPDANGWYNRPVSAVATGTDALSGLDSCTESVPYAGPDSASASASGRCTDRAANVASASATLQYDSTPPVVEVRLDRGPDANGWYNRPVSAVATGTDALSGLDSCTESVPYAGPDSASASASGRCTDRAANVASASATLQYDSTPPVVEVRLDRGPDANGWYNRPVSAVATGTDALSGLDSCTESVPYAGPDSASASASGRCTDRAANTTSAGTSLKYDATPPTVSFAGNRGTYGVLDTVAITCSATDALSGVSTHTCADVAGPASGFAVGVNEFSASAIDVAGNSAAGTTRFELVVQVDAMIGLVAQLVADTGIAGSLTKKLAAAQASMANGNLNAKAGQLKAFQNELAAQRGKKVPAAVADKLSSLSKAL